MLAVSGTGITAYVTARGSTSSWVSMVSAGACPMSSPCCVNAYTIDESARDNGGRLLFRQSTAFAPA